MASEAELRYLVTVQDRELRNLRKEVRDLNKEMGQAGDQGAKTLSDRMRDTGDQMVATGKKATRNLTLPIVALGVAAFKSFQQIESGQNAVTLATGATGKELDGLHKSYRDALVEGRKFGLTHEQVGQVVGDLNTHFGVTGPRLTAMAKQMAQFSRATGVDGSKAVGKINRVMKDWGIETEQMPGLLDKLTVAGQKTGVEVDSLMGQVVKFGVPMRNFGFDINESVALLSSFEAQGVNTELVMGSLRIATGKFAKEGKDLKTGLWDTIEAIKGAKNGSEAAAIAMDVFGRRAGADMAAAIREGRFEIDDLVGALKGSKGATAEVAESTVTASDRMRAAWTEVQLALLPLGAAISENISRAITFAVPIVQRISQAFSRLPGPLRDVTKFLLIAAAAAGPLLIVGGKMLVLMANMVPAIKALGAALTFLAANPVGLIIVGVVALVAAFVLAYKNSETFRNVVHGALTVVGNTASWLWSNAIKPAFDAISSATKSLWSSTIKPTFDAIKNTTVVVGNTMAWLWNNAISPAFSAIMTATAFLWNQVISRYFNLWIAIIRTTATTVSWLWSNAIKPVFNVIAPAVQGLWNTAFRPAFTSIAQVITAVGNTASWLWSNAIKPALDLIKPAVKGLWDNVIKPTSDKITAAWEKIGEGAGAMKDAMKTAFDFIKENVINPMKALFKAVANTFVEVVNKIGSGVSKIAEWVSKIPGVSITFSYSPIEKLADGKITNGPQIAMIGEDGPEAVIPLSRKRRRRGIELMSQAARIMGVAGIDPSAGLPRYANGVIVTGGTGPSVESMNALIKSSNRRGLFGKALDVLAGGLGAFVGAIPKITLDGPWAQTMAGLVGYIVDKAKSAATSMFRTAESHFGTADIIRARQQSERVMGRPYVWGGGRPPSWNHSGYDCSGFASTAWWEASGRRGGSGTTMSLFPASKAASGDLPFVFGFRGMSSNDPRQQHMGAKILGEWFQFGNPGRKGGGDSQWQSLRVPPYMPGYQGGTPYVPQTGPAMLHRGERVIPADGALVNIEHVTVRESTDIELIASRLSRKLALGAA